MNLRPVLAGFLAALLAFPMIASAQTSTAGAKSAKIIDFPLDRALQRRGFPSTDPRNVATRASIFAKIRTADAAAYGKMSRFLGRASPWINAMVFADLGLRVYGITGGGVREDADPTSYTPEGGQAPGDLVNRWRSGSYYANSLEQALYADVINSTIYKSVMGFYITNKQPVADYRPDISCDPYSYSAIVLVPDPYTGRPKNGPMRTLQCVRIASNCVGTEIGKGGICVPDYTADAFVPQPSRSTTYPTLEAWWNAQPDQVKDREAAPDLITEVANQAHAYSANQPGYEGVPYSSAGRAKTTDVGTSGRPTNREILDTPLADWPSPVTVPDSQINPAPGATQVDLGPDPGTPEPTLEEPPSKLMEPVKTALAPLMAANTSISNEACPIWQETVSFRGHTWNLRIADHCALLADWYDFIQGLCTALWALAGLLIVLGA